VGPINLIDLDDLPPAVTGTGTSKEKALLDLDSLDFTVVIPFFKKNYPKLKSFM
jgi:hypothetical protein